MDTMTTLPTRITVAGQDLRLATVTRTAWDATHNGGQFYVLPEPNPVGVPVVIAPATDPRSEGMWDDFASRGLPRFPGYRGWMIDRRHVEYVPDGPTPDERIREAVAAERRRLLDEFEAWKRNATEVAHRYADRNALCSEFDRCMEEIGLEPRGREYVVTLSRTVRQTAHVTVTAPNPDAAAENWQDEVPEYDIEWDDWDDEAPEVTDVEEA